MYNDITKLVHGDLITCILNQGAFRTRRGGGYKSIEFEHEIVIDDSLMLDNNTESTFSRCERPVLSKLKDGMQAVAIVKTEPRLVEFPTSPVCTHWGDILDNRWYSICVCEIIRSITLVDDRFYIEMGW